MEKNHLLETILKRMTDSGFSKTWDCVCVEMVTTPNRFMFTFYPRNFCFMENSYRLLCSAVGIDSCVSGLFILGEYKGNTNIGVRFFADASASLPNQLY